MDSDLGVTAFRTAFQRPKAGLGPQDELLGKEPHLGVCRIPAVSTLTISHPSWQPCSERCGRRQESKANRDEHQLRSAAQGVHPEVRPQGSAPHSKRTHRGAQEISDRPRAGVRTTTISSSSAIHPRCVLRDSIVSIAAGASSVGLCFIHGAGLPDPQKLLLGSGKQTGSFALNRPLCWCVPKSKPSSPRRLPGQR
jgi:hypothetical protein